LTKSFFAPFGVKWTVSHGSFHFLCNSLADFSLGRRLSGLSSDPELRAQLLQARARRDKVLAKINMLEDSKSNEQGGFVLIVHFRNM
jgi:hypothetical protein